MHISTNLLFSSTLLHHVFIFISGNFPFCSLSTLVYDSLFCSPVHQSYVSLNSVAFFIRLSCSVSDNGEAICIGFITLDIQWDSLDGGSARHTNSFYSGQRKKMWDIIDSPSRTRNHDTNFRVCAC